jgi:hypothetical protein
MPKIQATTKQSKEGWKSPDGKIVSFDIILEVDGQEFKCQTYSKQIAEVGWSGEVETYEKKGYTYVKQPQKEGWDNGGGGGAPRGGGGGNRPPQDNYTMYLSYVKDIAVALIAADKYSTDQLNEIANDVATTGEMFYAMRPDAPAATDTTKSDLDKVFDGETGS